MMCAPRPPPSPWLCPAAPHVPGEGCGAPSLMAFSPRGPRTATAAFGAQGGAPPGPSARTEGGGMALDRPVSGAGQWARVEGDGWDRGGGVVWTGWRFPAVSRAPLRPQQPPTPRRGHRPRPRRPVGLMLQTHLGKRGRARTPTNAEMMSPAQRVPPPGPPGIRAPAGDPCTVRVGPEDRPSSLAWNPAPKALPGIFLCTFPSRPSLFTPPSHSPPRRGGPRCPLPRRPHSGGVHGYRHRRPTGSPGPRASRARAHPGGTPPL